MSPLAQPSMSPESMLPPLSPPPESLPPPFLMVTLRCAVAVTPSLSVATGSTVDLDNKDTVEHTFTVDGQDVDVDIQPSATATATIDLPAGSYDFHCKIHPNMTGTLTVTG